VFVCPVSRLLSEAVNLGAELVDADRGREAHARVPLRTVAVAQSRGAWLFASLRALMAGVPPVGGQLLGAEWVQVTLLTARWRVRRP